jgi:hypothetical protein
MENENLNEAKTPALSKGDVSGMFICGCCKDEWENSFMCEACSSGEEVVYDAMGYETDNPICINTCYNCCDCHSK